MDYEFSDGRLHLRRTPEEREPLLHRLRRIEGQVRGLQQMLQQDRYCGDELQQADAVIAAMREVALLIAGQHMTAGVEYAGPDAIADFPRYRSGLFGIWPSLAQVMTPGYPPGVR